jgi:hypothetical protein
MKNIAQKMKQTLTKELIISSFYKRTPSRKIKMSKLR